jgi:hypothetical protein
VHDLSGNAAPACMKPLHEFDVQNFVEIRSECHLCLEPSLAIKIIMESVVFVRAKCKKSNKLHKVEADEELAQKSRSIS